MTDTAEIIEYANPWTFQGEPFVEVPKGIESFVYLMTNQQNGMQYIGKKGFYFMKTRQVNKKKKRYKADSDWREYYSSSDEINAMVAAGVPFTREILHLCKGKGTANYLEAREQFDRRVLENRDRWYNGQIQVRVHHSQLKM